MLAGNCQLMRSRSNCGVLRIGVRKRKGSLFDPKRFRLRQQISIKRMKLVVFANNSHLRTAIHRGSTTTDPHGHVKELGYLGTSLSQRDGRTRRRWRLLLRLPHLDLSLYARSIYTPFSSKHGCHGITERSSDTFKYNDLVKR